MPMTTPGKFDSNGAWDGFRGESGRKRSMSAILSRKTTLHMMETKHS